MPAMLTETRIAYLMLFSAPAMFAVNILVARWMAGTAPPVALAFWRWFGVLLLMLILRGSQLWEQKRDILQEWKELRRFQKLDEKNRKIVFYLENEYYATYFEKLIKELTNVHGLTICYVTSSKTDPILNSNNDKILAFYVGDGTARTNFFMNLKADILVMTMPDLETFHIKRSKVHNVHYVYAFHSIVSTHMIYRKKIHYFYFL